MSGLEGRIAEALLGKIRSRRDASTKRTPERSIAGPRGAATVVSLREAQFSDFDRVCALNLKLGQGPDSRENWHRLWLDNPALPAGDARPTIGWILEASREIVGFLGSIPLLYELEGKILMAATTCRLVVEPEFRAQSHLLVTSFFRQKNVDLFLNSTATVSAGKMMTALKATQLPQKDYGTVLFWVLNPRQFTKAVLGKMGFSSSLAGAGGLVGSLLLRGDIAIRQRLPRVTSAAHTIVETSLNEMGHEFEQFWLDEFGRTPRLLAKRTPTIMRWHFDPPHNRRKVSVFLSRVDGRLAGYVVVRHEPETTPGVRRSLIADLMVKNDDPEIVGQLLTTACQLARNTGSHVLEVMGFPRNLRQGLLRWKPYSRKYPACPFFYKAKERALQEKLADEDVWYASPFDGDATLWP